MLGNGFWWACSISLFTVVSIFLPVLIFTDFFSNKRIARATADIDDVGSETAEARLSSSLGDDPKGFDYEVFLSFRGTDTRKGFTDFLYNSLKDAGVRVFRDNEELRVGEEIGPDLLEGIKKSKISIPIFSKDYASSKWCLKEVAFMVECRKKRNQLVLPIFFDVAPNEVRHQSGSYTGAFSKHERKFEANIVGQWRDALAEIGALKGWEVVNVANGHQGELIKLVVAKVLRELKKAYLSVTDNIVGIEDHVQAVMRLLETDASDVRIVGVHGMGGIGKTTIAKVIYNQLVDNFESCCFLKDIRETTVHKGLEYLQSLLLSRILRCERPDFASTDEGMYELKHRLRDKRVLIFLDDVDRRDQLTALAAELSWFGPGSRIIITTRNRDVLNVSQVYDSYEITELHPHQAFVLLCKNAFRNDLPAIGFADLSLAIASTTGGLPLALEVIGSFLSGKRIAVWESTLKKLRKIPHMDVQEKLRISYDALDHEQKQIFLDIACLFIGSDVRIASHMWEDYDFFPEVGLEVLLLMSLIKIGSDNEIWMHDQLRGLGREIVRQENYNEPGKRSRLWNTEEAIDILERCTGSSSIEALRLHFGMDLVDYCFRDDQFSNMSSLRFLQLDFATLAGNFQLLSKLRWLAWSVRASTDRAASLNLKNLVVLDLSWSRIGEDWSGWSSIQMAVKLKVLNLTGCLDLARTPDFSTFPNLEKLVLEDCRNLVEIDASIRHLKCLGFLNLRRCWKLKKLPHQLGSMKILTELLIDETCVQELPISTGMKKLEILSAKGCKELTQLPASTGRLVSLSDLVLDSSGICHLPDSVGSLVQLRRLSLMKCGSLRELPESIGQLTSLVELILSHSRVRKLPDSIGNLKNLEVLNVEYSQLECFPSSIGMLEKLESINASKCKKLKGPIPDELGRLSMLRLLILKHTRVDSLPACINGLCHLHLLDLEGCKKLQTIPDFPSSIVCLRVTCKSMLTFPDISSLVHLKELCISRCFKLEQVPEEVGKLYNLEKLVISQLKISSLPEGIGGLSRLKEVIVDRCFHIKCLPPLPLGLYKLKVLECYSLEVLPNLSNMKNLSDLRLNDCSELKEVPGLEDLTLLTNLDVVGCPCLSNLDGLECLESIRGLTVSKCESLERLPNLSRLKKLPLLMASDCKKLVGIEGLDDLDGLESVFMSWCTSLEALPRLSSNVKCIYLAWCKNLHDLSGLEELESLELLNLTECRAVRQLPNLSNLQKLRDVDLQGCESVVEIEGLEEVKSLKTLNVAGCTLLRNLPLLPGVRVNTTERHAC